MGWGAYRNSLVLSGDAVTLPWKTNQAASDVDGTKDNHLHQFYDLKECCFKMLFPLGSATVCYNQPVQKNHTLNAMVD